MKPKGQGDYFHLTVYCVFLIIVAFILDEPANIMQGFIRISYSPSNLITDYIAVGGIGAAFFNSGVISIISVFLLRVEKVRLTGPIIAAVITISGFAFFGKNLYNSMPITAGVYLYALLKKISFESIAVTSLFATALGPLVSVISFGLGLDIWKGIIIGCVAGIMIGLVMPPLSNAFLQFHQGFNLYNIGFTAGMVGMFATGVLRMFDLSIETVSILSSGNDLALSIIVLTIFLAVLITGLYLNGWSMTGYRALMRNSGRLINDFVHQYGYGITLVNMAVMGFLAWGYVILTGCNLNGATLGAIFTLMGFSAFGTHPQNTIPIITGVFLASLLNIYEIHSTEAVISALFGTTLAPIAGYFGPAAGVFAGFAHVSMVMNIGYLHGGVNLYNNGFSGGFIAATLVPILSAISERRRKDRKSCSEEDIMG